MPVFVDDIHEARNNPHIPSGDIQKMKNATAERYYVYLYPPCLVLVDRDHPAYRTVSIDHEALFVLEKIEGDLVDGEYVFSEGQEELLESKCEELNASVEK